MHDFMSAVANPQGSARKFQFIGGELCLDFTNTVGGRRGATAREYLNSYGDFVSWCRQAGLLDDSGVEALARGAARRPRDSATALSRAIALRETLYRVFAALVLKAQPKPFDLDHLNLELSAHLGRLRVVPGQQGFNWTWAEADPALKGPLGPIARSAADLLTSPNLLERVRQCEGDGCGWLFLDATKNQSRRWCIMSDCGNVAKVRRFRLKQIRTGDGKSGRGGKG